jgi:predicted RNA-binding protein YlxR (DUF448 family)
MQRRAQGKRARMSRGKGHVPVRTCVSCGAKRSKGDLIRFVLDRDMRLIRDDSGHRAGRGAYACKGSPCVEKLMNPKRAGNPFRVPRAQNAETG